MSQKVSRKSAISEEKEKKPADSPVKDMKKKMATAEKEKTTDKTEKVTEKPKATEKTDKPVEKGEKSVEKKVEKIDKSVEKKTEKVDNKVAVVVVEKNDNKAEKTDKKVEKNDKKAEKVEKPTEKKETQQKKEEGSSKEDKNAKVDKEKPDTKAKKPQNGARQNGTNGTDANGVISCDSSDEEQDEMFPELAYDDSDDVDFEPNERTSRSYTRRSQVKATRTPETPRPASDKQTDKEDDSKETKVIKLKEDANTDRKLRSADSPKPQDKKDDAKAEDKDQLEKEDKPAENKEEKKDGDSTEIEIAVEVEANDADQSRKTDTNFSKSRVKVSPYRRSLRIQDQTNTSVQANYTGNNTTMEMDITESSISEEADDSYLRGLKTIRGRTSYKPLKQMTLRHIVNTSQRSNTSVSAATSDSRPTGTVVGRKRRPEERDLQLDAAVEGVVRKRMRVLDTLTAPFRRVATAIPMGRRHAEIVGINTDLPLSAPLVTELDPETLKPPTEPPIAVPLPTPEERENKRCVVM